jgi:ribosomal protein S27AE
MPRHLRELRDQFPPTADQKAAWASGTCQRCAKSVVQTDAWRALALCPDCVAGVFTAEHIASLVRPR